MERERVFVIVNLIDGARVEIEAISYRQVQLGTVFIAEIIVVSDMFVRPGCPRICDAKPDSPGNSLSRLDGILSVVVTDRRIAHGLRAVELKGRTVAEAPRVIFAGKTQ